MFYLATLKINRAKTGLYMCVFYESYFIENQRNELHFNFGIGGI